MSRFPILFAAVAAAAFAGEEVPFVPGQGSDQKLTDAERSVAKLAIDVLAADLQISGDGIQVDTIRAIEWPDSSVGCPKPGMAYLDVIAPGHRITLRVDGRIYTVHEAGNHAFVCRQMKALGGITPQLDLVFGEQMVFARKDLAGRIGVPESEIRIGGAEENTWDDASLGCPEPGGLYPPGRVTGWILTLKHGMRDYTYHTDLRRTIPCPGITAN